MGRGRASGVSSYRRRRLPHQMTDAATRIAVPQDPLGTMDELLSGDHLGRRRAVCPDFDPQRKAAVILSL
ncbi:MAG: hypothetical protein JO285_14245 [Kutzneria sp.]|nr:hypothetical protein [Kutzneria sp.]